MLQESLLYFIFIFSVIVFACAEPWSVALLQILIACLLLLVTWKGRLSFSGPVQRWLVPGILILVFIGGLQSLQERPASFPNTTLFFTTSVWATRKAILLWLSYAALLLCAPTVLADPSRLRRFSWLVFSLGVFTAAAGLGIRSANTGLLLGFRQLPYWGVAPFGPFVNRDHAASFLAMTGLMGWGLFFSKLPGLSDSRYRTKFFDSLALSLLALAMVGTIAFCLFKTGSRGGTHAFFMATGFMGFLASTFFTKGRWRYLSYTGLLSACGIYAYLLHQFPQWRGYVDGNWIDALQWRASMYRSGLEMFRDFPVTGVGLGSFMHGFPPYQEPLVKGVVEHIHGDWLESILQAGIFGFAALAASLLAVLAIGLHRWVRCPSRELRALSGGALGGVIVLSIHMFMEFPFQIPANAVTLLLLLCMVGSRAILKGKRPDEDEFSSPQPPIWMKTVVTVFAIGMIGFSIPPIIAEGCYFLGQQSPDHSKAYFFNRAVSWDPNPKYARNLGQAYSKAASKSPLARPTLLRKGLDATATLERRYPLDSRLRKYREYSVYILGRQKG